MSSTTSLRWLGWLTGSFCNCWVLLVIVGLNFHWKSGYILYLSIFCLNISGYNFWSLLTKTSQTCMCCVADEIFPCRQEQDREWKWICQVKLRSKRRTRGSCRTMATASWTTTRSGSGTSASSLQGSSGNAGTIPRWACWRDESHLKTSSSTAASRSSFCH